VHLVGFTIEIYHDARSHEHITFLYYFLLREWKQKLPPKRRPLSAKLHGVTSCKTKLEDL